MSTMQYLSFTQVAQLLGITTGALGSLSLPEPDALIGRTRGWKQSTIEQWNMQRPGKGNRTPRKKQ